MLNFLLLFINLTFRAGLDTRQIDILAHGDQRSAAFMRECDFVYDGESCLVLKDKYRNEVDLSRYKIVKGVVIHSDALGIFREYYLSETNSENFNNFIKNELHDSFNINYELTDQITLHCPSNVKLTINIGNFLYDAVFNNALNAFTNNLLFDPVLNYAMDVYAMAYIQKHPHIKALYYSNYPRDCVPDQLLNRLNLEAFSELQILEIDDTKAGDSFFSQLEKLTCLEQLHISENPNLTADNIDSLTKLKRLRILKLDCCQNVGNGCLNKISQMENLEYLSIDALDANVQITDEGFKQIARLKNLKRISLGNLSISDQTLKELSKIESLREVNIYYCPNITSDGIKSLQTLPELRVLNVSDCQTLAESKTVTVLNFPKLETLSVDFRIEIKSSRLKELFVSNVTDFDGSSLDFFDSLPSLECLCLDNCQNVSDAGIKRLVRLKNLKSLSINDCPLIIDRSLDYLTENNPVLSVVSKGCPSVKKYDVWDGGLRGMTADIINQIKYGSCQVYKPEPKKKR